MYVWVLLRMCYYVMYAIERLVIGKLCSGVQAEEMSSA